MSAARRASSAVGSGFQDTMRSALPDGWSQWLVHTGLFYGLYGTIIGAITTFTYIIIGWLRDGFVLEVDIDQADASTVYTWMRHWIALRLGDNIGARCKVSASSFSSRFQRGGNRRGGGHGRGRGGGRGGGRVNASETELAYLPRDNVRVRFWYQNRLCWVTGMTRRISEHEGERRLMCIVVLFGSRALVSDLIQEAKTLYEEELKAMTVMRTPRTVGFGQAHWGEIDPRPSRPFDTVVLDADLATEMLDDVRTFLESKDWYYSRGVPYRRGYLLYGPPGCGKTSFVTALAGELHQIINIVSLASKLLTDDSLLQLMSTAEEGSILLLEDVDAAFRSTAGDTDGSGDAEEGDRRQRVDARRNGNTTGITFSGLLNAIDGVAAQEGKVVVMTTNHIERLDEALIRPGRVDVRTYIGRATRRSAHALFLRFYRGLTTMAEEDVARCAGLFSAQVPDKEYTPALIQGHLMNHKFDPQAAVDSFETLRQLAASLGGAPVLDDPQLAPLSRTLSEGPLAAADEGAVAIMDVGNIGTAFLRGLSPRSSGQKEGECRGERGSSLRNRGVKNIAWIPNM